jgi:murein DD-endopeptidase MepM/ murein hydrolase activator NlpD
MKLLKPIKGFITQRFGENANDWYKNHGLLGHPGIDFDGVDFTPIYASHNGEVEVVNKTSKDPMKYKAVVQYFENEGVRYEITYGHLSKIYVTRKQYVLEGEPIGLMGNTGEAVFSGGKQVTKKEKENGSQKGAHLHYQLRPVDKHNNPLYPDNGYRGCIDPMPRLYNPTIKEWLNTIKKVVLHYKEKINNYGLE